MSASKAHPDVWQVDRHGVVRTTPRSDWRRVAIFVLGALLAWSTVSVVQTLVTKRPIAQCITSFYHDCR